MHAVKDYVSISLRRTTHAVKDFILDFFFLQSSFNIAIDFLHMDLQFVAAQDLISKL